MGCNIYLFVAKLKFNAPYDCECNSYDTVSDGQIATFRMAMLLLYI